MVSFWFAPGVRLVTYKCSSIATGAEEDATSGRFALTMAPGASLTVWQVGWHLHSLDPHQGWCDWDYVERVTGKSRKEFRRS